MDVILPDQGIHLLTWDAHVLPETHEKLSAAPEGRVNVTMPPADLAAKRNLKEEFTRLGEDLEHLDGTVGAALTEVEIPVSAPWTRRPRS